MARTSRIIKSLVKLILPIVLLLLIAVCGGSIWLVYQAAHPAATKYILTPEKYGILSARAAQVTEESWPNKDGSTSHGWLLRGAENAPAVVLFHRYGTDRSHLLDLGVKLNESTNFTILMPDLRGHGQDPAGQRTTFAGCAATDAASAIEFLRGLRTPTEIALVGKKIGVYGIELGSLYALNAAGSSPDVAAIALDSVPEDSDQLLEQVVATRYPFMSSITSRLAKLGTYFYFYDGCFDRRPTCQLVKDLQDRKVLLLAGVDAPAYAEPTARLAKCFPASSKAESKLDLSPSGFGVINASMEQSEAYDQRLIEFFRSSLGD